MKTSLKEALGPLYPSYVWNDGIALEWWRLLTEAEVRIMFLMRASLRREIYEAA